MVQSQVWLCAMIMVEGW